MTRKIPGGHQDADARGATGRRLGIVVSVAILTTLSVLLFGPSVHEVLMDADGDRALVRTANELGVHRVTVRTLRSIG